MFLKLGWHVPDQYMVTCTPGIATRTVLDDLLSSFNVVLSLLKR